MGLQKSHQGGWFHFLAHGLYGLDRILLKGRAVTLTFKVGTQILRATRRLNMVVTSAKLFPNPTSNNEVMDRHEWDVWTDGQGSDYILPNIFSSIKMVGDQ